PSRGAPSTDPHPQEAHQQRCGQQPQLHQQAHPSGQVPSTARGRVRRGPEADPGQCQPRGGAGETHPRQVRELFAQAPVDQFPGTAVESVTDSSRYFVIRIEDGNGRRAFIGIGFGDRGDAFDFNVALQDHFKWVKQQCEFAKQAQNPDQGPKLDLGFKEGQTIKLNIANMKKKEGAAGNPRARPASTGGLSLLPPPPGGKTSTLIPPPGEQLAVGGSLTQPAVAPSSGGAPVPWPQPKPATADIWGDFTKSTGSTSSQTQPGTGWVQF
uniref:NECAP PHear domain-containing protein n=1 Tax=Macaca fascicularis TaxID=9541 RepID=A0A7N9D8H3_MACFA